MATEGDPLIILDCCNAGLGAATNQHINVLTNDVPISSYKKELIEAYGWSVSTGDQMSSAVCEVSNRRLSKMGIKTRADVKIEQGIRDMSTSTLIHAMNSLIIKKYVKIGLPDHAAPARAVHYLLRQSQKGKLVLEGLKHKRHRRLRNDNSDLLARNISTPVQNVVIKKTLGRRKRKLDF